MPLGPYPRRLTERLTHWAREAPERTFVAKRDASGQWRRLSYGEALLRARAVGAALLERGLSVERPLMILSENDIEHAVLALAALHVGVPFVPVSPAYSLASRDHGRLRELVDLMTPGLVFAADGVRYAPALADAVPDATELVVTDGNAERSATRFGALLEGRPDDADRAHEAVTADSVAKFLFTSGSTGTPKAVICSQRMLASNQQMLAQALPFLTDSPPVLVDWLPWHHSFGGNHNFGIALYNGGALYIDDGKPTGAHVARTIENLREIPPSVYFNVPRGFEELVPALERDLDLAKRFFSRLELLFYAGASLSQSTWERLEAVSERAVGERVVIMTGLGMTETGPFSMCANWDTRRTGSVGHPAPGTEIRLAPAGDKFEVRYRGPSVTSGFHRRPELAVAAFDEGGFYKSGDAIRFVDPEKPDDGFVFDGRIAEDFKLDTGAWVNVGPLRARVLAATAPYVRDVVVTGHDRSDVGALLVVDAEALRDLVPDLSDGASPEAFATHRAVVAHFGSILRAINARSRHTSERVARALLFVEPLSMDRGEMTDKGSVNQRAVLAARSELIERLHAATATDHDARILLAR